MKNYNIKFGRGYELPIIGILALYLKDTEKAIYDIDEIQQFLKTQKGFGAFGIGAKQRIMYSAILASQLQMSNNDSTMETAVINSVTSLIIAQQAALIAIMAASILPDTVIGYISPYPTVVKVAVAHHIM